MQKKLITLDINSIKPYENNPRFNENAVEAVKESISQCKYIAPIIVDEDNVILAGHTRYKALVDLGETDIEVMQVSGLTKAQKKKYRLLDNKTNELASWDFDRLAKEIEDIDFEGYDFGFEMANFDISFDNLVDGEKEKTAEEPKDIVLRVIFDDINKFRKCESDLRTLLENERVSISSTIKGAEEIEDI